MARRRRLQFPGARYHIINRGNYRADIFSSAGAAQAFLLALAEACEGFGWRIHAYALLRNHFHLALETPEPNLMDGMHWLQNTYATRFNRFRSERGRLWRETGVSHRWMAGQSLHGQPQLGPLVSPPESACLQQKSTIIGLTPSVFAAHPSSRSGRG